MEKLDPLPAIGPSGPGRPPAIAHEPDQLLFPDLSVLMPALLVERKRAVLHDNTQVLTACASDDGYTAAAGELMDSSKSSKDIMSELQNLWDTAWDDVRWHEKLSTTASGWGPNELYALVDIPHRFYSDLLLDQDSPRRLLLGLLKQTPYPNTTLAADEVRILTILPGQYGSVITCSLENVPLEKCIHQGYTALSYSWGPPTQPQYAIVVNGRIMVVGEQLFIALVYKRQYDAAKRYWIDAICIRQDDNGEKTHQLPMMGRIYAAATEVDIWLGSDEGDCNYAIEVIRDGHVVAKQVDARFVRSLANLLRRPWFSRVWIMQELALAPSQGPWIQAGYSSTFWSKFIDAVRYTLANCRQRLPLPPRTEETHLQYLQRSARHSRNEWERASASMSLSEVLATSPVSLLDELRRAVHMGDPLSLPQVLFAARGSQAGDPRDKVYGLLGLIDKEGQDTLRPNYEKSKAEVYRDATTVLLKTFCKSQWYCTLPTLVESQPGSPSWVLDFSYACTRYAEHIVMGPDGSLTSDDWDGNSRLDIRGPDNTTLVTYATIVDSISGICTSGIEQEVAWPAPPTPGEGEAIMS